MKSFFLSFSLFSWRLALSTMVCFLSFSTVAQATTNALPDGESLLLRPKVGPIIYEYDIYTLNKNGKLYHSLSDVIDILELAVDFNETTGRGQGWFLREDWEINIDIPNQKIISKDQNYSLGHGASFVDEGVFFVSQEALTQWFDMSFETDIAQQYLEVITPYPLPGVARYYRQKKKNRSNKNSNIAKLPRHKIKYDWFDINTSDVNLRTRYRRYADTDPSWYRSGSVAVEGQLLKHEAYTFVNADSDNNLTSVVARLSKKDENPVLLGPLKARSYTLGDTTVTDIPLTGSTTQELGFHVGNSVNGQAQFQTTDITGDALPGWDVELYRNGILSSSLVIGNDGFYEFSDIQLFGGDNKFELFFYGPQGEIRKRALNVPVTPALLAAQNGTYDVSVSLSETRTFRKYRSDDVDQETPHIAARYNKAFGNVLAYVGVRNRDIEKENKSFFATGFTTLVKDMIIDGNLAVDDKAKAAGEIALRKNIHDWNISASTLVQNQEYKTEGNLNPKVLKMEANVQRTFTPTRGTRTGLFLSSSYVESGDDVKNIRNRVGGSLQKGRFNFSNNLLYDKQSTPEGNDTERRTNALSARTNYGKYFFRGGIDYRMMPDSQVDRYFAQANYYPTPRFSGDIRLDHEPNRDFSQMRLGLTYKHDYFRTSPFMEWDNQKEFLVGLNLNFSLIDVPYKRKPMLTSDRTLGRGLVSSFVFHDENGNNEFDKNEKVLPDVVVESVNVKRRATTNDDGYSLISNLPAGRATDIRLDQYSLPDPYMLSATKGVSIFPSAGEIVDLRFPVHMSGEIDGTIFVRDKDGEATPLKRAAVILYPIGKKKSEEIKVEAAYDGFYVASQIPPGKYVMTVTNETASRANASLPAPRLVDIGYEGETIYGYDFELDRTRVNVPIDIVYHDKGDVMADISYRLKAGAAPQSKLLGLVGKLRHRQSHGRDLFAGLREVEVQDQGAKIYKGTSDNIDEGHQKCRELLENAVSCVLQIHIPSQVKSVQTAQTSLH